MKALIQRVKHAKVQVDNKDISSINEGLLVFLGIHKEDTFCTHIIALLAHLSITMVICPE